jgi:hypothetical protein
MASPALALLRCETTAGPPAGIAGEVDDCSDGGDVALATPSAF